MALQESLGLGLQIHKLELIQRDSKTSQHGLKGERNSIVTYIQVPQDA